MKDPWDIETYGLDIDCDIPLCDEDAEDIYRDQHGWAFDKLEQYRTVRPLDEGHLYGSDQASPGNVSVVIKPRQNLAGLSEGVRCGKFADMNPHEVWQRYCYGAHYSIDIPMLDGYMPSHPLSIMRGHYSINTLGMYFAWEVAPSDKEIGAFAYMKGLRYTTERILQRLGKSFRGVINLEMRDGVLIEMHLRPSAEFFPIYGKKCVQSIFDFYEGKRDNLYPAKSGFVVVQPKGLESLELGATCGEASWRERLWYHREQAPQGASEQPEKE